VAKQQSSNAPSNARRIAKKMLNAKHVRNVRNATNERFQDLKKNLAFINVRIGLWISPISHLKSMIAVELKRPQTEILPSRRGLTDQLSIGGLP